jgi:cytochrome c oxidase subunit 2
MSSDHESKNEAIATQVAPVVRTTSDWTRPAIRIFIIWAVMTAIGVVIGIVVPDHVFPRIMSAEMKDVRDTMVFFTVVAAPIAALVLSISFYAWHKWRVKGKRDIDTPPPDGPAIHGNGLTTSLWIGMSVVGVLIALFWGMTALASETAPQANAIHVSVTGQQWIWTFHYPGTGITTTQPVLPVNRQIQFDITSDDVTHGFWPVQLGVQMDANATEVTHIGATPEKLGQFDIRCSQICGLYHAYMQTKGHVVSQKQFNAWLISHGASTTAVHAYAVGSN